MGRDCISIQSLGQDMGAGQAQSGRRWALGVRMGAQGTACGSRLGRWAVRAGVSGRTRRRQVRRGARSAGGRCAGARGAQAAARAAGAGGAGGARDVGAWACLCAQAGRAGWSAGLVLVHSAPGSVLTQSLTDSTRYFS